MVSIPTIDLKMTGHNIAKLRKAAGLSVHDLRPCIIKFAIS